jgi:hypothetical protein
MDLLYTSERCPTADNHRQQVVDHDKLGGKPFAWHERQMPSNSRAGGCFLTIFILLGFLFGLSIRNPLKGTLIGLAVGAVLAIATWLIDRNRKA